MSHRNLRLLSLDGGGVRGLSSLMILQQLMSTINPEAPPKPCEYFDMIGGTSTGGLIAVMLGRLQMTVDECITAYTSLSDKVFEKKRSRVTLTGKLQGRFDSDALEDAIKGILTDRSLDADTLLRDAPGATCKVFVCATSKETRDTVCLTSFRSPRGATHLYETTTIWQACRATSAATTFFNSIALGPFHEVFVDGALGVNNPIYILWSQAQDIWGADKLQNQLQCIISIGTGAPSLEPIHDDLFNITATLIAIATETEKTAEQFQRDKSVLDDEGRYYRFNVTHGLEGVDLQESRKINQISAATGRYIRSQEVFKRLKACAHQLVERDNHDLHQNSNYSSTSTNNPAKSPQKSVGGEDVDVISTIAPCCYAQLDTPKYVIFDGLYFPKIASPRQKCHLCDKSDSNSPMFFCLDCNTTGLIRPGVTRPLHEECARANNDGELDRHEADHWLRKESPWYSMLFSDFLTSSALSSESLRACRVSLGEEFLQNYRLRLQGQATNILLVLRLDPGKYRIRLGYQFYPSDGPTLEKNMGVRQLFRWGWSESRLGKLAVRYMQADDQMSLPQCVDTVNNTFKFNTKKFAEDEIKLNYERIRSIENNVTIQSGHVGILNLRFNYDEKMFTDAKPLEWELYAISIGKIPNPQQLATKSQLLQARIRKDQATELDHRQQMRALELRQAQSATYTQRATRPASASYSLPVRGVVSPLPGSTTSRLSVPQPRGRARSSSPSLQVHKAAAVSQSSENLNGSPATSFNTLLQQYSQLQQQDMEMQKAQEFWTPLEAMSKRDACS